jgi:hypothetical protein
MSDPRIGILEKVAIATEPHRDDVVLCGGMAAFLICRQAEAQTDAAMTEDVDLTIERKASRQKTLKLSNTPTIAEGLKKVGFEREIKAFPIGDGKPAEKWVQDGDSFYIEFLTDDHRQQVHEISGIKAQGLSYFNMSLDNTFLYRLPSGRELRVVAASAFEMHKILTFVRRKSPGKKFKDLYYIAFVGGAVYGSPEELAAELGALDITAAWTKTAATNLGLLAANLAAWAPRIKDNDPTGTLTEASIMEFFGRLAAAYKAAGASG